MKYHVFKPSQAVWVHLGDFDTYGDAKDYIDVLIPPSGQYIILKDTYPENRYGAPKLVANVSYPVISESEVHGD